MSAIKRLLCFTYHNRICCVTTDWKISLPLLFISCKAMDVNLCGPTDACIMARLLFWRVSRLIRRVIKDITRGTIYSLHLISRLGISITVWDIKVSSMGNYTLSVQTFSWCTETGHERTHKMHQSRLLCHFKTFLYRSSVVNEVWLMFMHGISSYWSNFLGCSNYWSVLMKQIFYSNERCRYREIRHTLP